MVRSGPAHQSPVLIGAHSTAEICKPNAGRDEVGCRRLTFGKAEGKDNNRLVVRHFSNISLGILCVLGTNGSAVRSGPIGIKRNTLHRV